MNSDPCWYDGMKESEVNKLAITLLALYMVDLQKLTPEALGRAQTMINDAVRDIPWL